MKKLLAILLAALMALTGALALAEDVSENSGLLLTMEYDVNREALADVLTTLGISEQIQGIADTAAALIDEAGERLFWGDDHVEWGLTLKGSDIVNLAADYDGETYVLSSSLIPSYALTLSEETVEQLMNRLAEELSSTLEGVDLEAVTMALAGYFGEFIDTCKASVIMGEPEQGEFEANGRTYNTKMPITVDLETIAAAAQNLVKQLNEDEAVQAALQALQDKGVNVTLDEGEAVAEQVPILDMALYMNVDEYGEPDGPVEVLFTMTEADADNPAINGDVLVIDGVVTVTLDFARTDDSQLVVTYGPTEDGNQLRVDATTQGLYAGFDASTGYDESAEAILLDANLYVLDAETPLISERGRFVFDGQLAQYVTAEGKTTLAVEDLMDESSGELMQQLADDLVQNGLGGIITAALEAMPEEISALGALFMGGSEAA